MNVDKRKTQVEVLAPASKPRSLHRLWRLRIDLSRTPDESDHHQGKRGTQVRGEAQRGRGEKGRNR